MISPPILYNEAERLLDLYSLQQLDTPPEERFDRITNLVSKVFDVPIAYIALVDANRQWFKSKCGLRMDSTSREVSFCGHTIAQDSLLVINDASKDERFHDNPMVIDDPHIRFYAGYPLRGPDGHNIGTLCIADCKPRNSVDSDQTQIFVEFAEIAEYELGLVDLISTQKELLNTKDQLLTTQKRLEQEVNTAARYIKSLLPGEIVLPGIQVLSRFIPSSELGGDFIGYVPLNHNCLAFYLLDVTGHGIAASLLAVSVGNMIRQKLQNSDSILDPGQLLTEINSSFQMQDHDGRFVTIWFGIIDIPNRSMQYACAGHHPAVMFTGGELIHFGHSGLPIGVVPETIYETHKSSLPNESSLFLFSDGLFEITTDSNGSKLGLNNFEAMLQTQVVSNPNNVLDTIISEISTIESNPRFDDDVSMIQVQIKLNNNAPPSTLAS